MASISSIAQYFSFPEPTEHMHDNKDPLINKKWKVTSDTVELLFSDELPEEELDQVVIFRQSNIILKKYKYHRNKFYSVVFPRCCFKDANLFSNRITLPEWYHQSLYYIRFVDEITTPCRCYPSDCVEEEFDSTFVIVLDEDGFVQDIEMLFDPIFCQIVKQ